MRVIVGAIIVLTELLAAPRGASAQDGRWGPWLGCWELVNENVREGVGAARASALSPDPAAGAVTASAPRVCAVRAGENGAKLTTTVPDQEPVEQTLIPDGSARPIDDAECRGTEHTEWSRNGQRLFARAEVTCADGTPRAISGLGLITPDDIWLDIRSFRVGSRVTTRVSRYRRADSDTSAFAPFVGSLLTLSEVKEANAKVSAPVLEAALAETRPRLEVSSRTLVELADADVAPSVIDVMVALAYPDRFVIERTDRRSYSSSATRQTNDPFYPFGIDDYYDSGFFYPSYYYSPFGYGYIGRYDPFVFGPGYVVGAPGDGGVRPSGTGRAINGLGYTQIRPAEASDIAAASGRATGDGTSGTRSSGSSSSRRSAASGDSGTATPRGYSGGSSSPPPSSDSGSSGSSGGGSSSSSGGGSSSGGSSGASSSGGDGGGGRTAQPR